MMKSYAKFALGILAFLAVSGIVSTEPDARLVGGDAIIATIEALEFIPKTIIKFLVKGIGSVLNIFFDIDLQSICDDIDNFSLGEIVVEYLDEIFGGDTTDPEPSDVEIFITLIEELGPFNIDQSYFKGEGDSFRNLFNYLTNTFKFSEALTALEQDQQTDFEDALKFVNGFNFMMTKIEEVDWDNFKTILENGNLENLFLYLQDIDFTTLGNEKYTHDAFDYIAFDSTDLATIDLENSQKIYAQAGPMLDFVNIIVTNKDDILAFRDEAGDINYAGAYAFFNANSVLQDLKDSIDSVHTFIDEATFVPTLTTEYLPIMVKVFSQVFKTYLEEIK